MTLNLTVTTPSCIYQSADYRLTNTKTRERCDFKTQKIVLVNASRWNATVCFAGVGRTHNLDVGEWLAERVAAIQFHDPFERLLDELLKAKSWLSTVPPPDDRHSFSVGAFVGSEPVFVLVSNFEQPFGTVSPTASANLSAYQLRPTKPTTYVSGARSAVTRAERRQLERLAARDPEPQRMYSALARANHAAADRSNGVSQGCFTAHVRLTGDSGGYVHDPDNRPFIPTFAFPAVARETITQLLDKQFGPGRARLVQMASARADESDDYHKTQLREKPGDASAHSNYGVFLKEKKGDLAGAEREYRKAIELDSNHVNALGNLANLLGEKRDKDQATIFYRRALEAGPGHENVTWNYARFLWREFDDRQAARDVLDRGIIAHPESGRLLLLRANLSLINRNVVEALEDFRRAREQGADQAGVEAGHAIALQLSGAPIGECIAAYHLAIQLTPQNGALRLNLAQLLFIKGDDPEANRQLREAMRAGLEESAQLEAQFYLLAHTSSDPAVIFQTTKSLLTRGARLRWNVRPNIETVSRRDPRKAVLLELVSEVMAGERAQVCLDQVLARWPQKSAR
jgi:Flp pilus assembly protein TadD